jgi:hypothetical protein
MFAGNTAGASSPTSLAPSARAGIAGTAVAVAVAPRCSFNFSIRSAQLQTAGSDPSNQVISNSSSPRSARRDAHTAAWASDIVLNGMAAIAYLGGGGGLCSAVAFFFGDFMESTIESPSTGPKVLLMNVCNAPGVVSWGYLASVYLRRTVVSCSPGIPIIISLAWTVAIGGIARDTHQAVVARAPPAHSFPLVRPLPVVAAVPPGAPRPIVCQRHGFVRLLVRTSAFS